MKKSTAYAKYAEGRAKKSSLLADTARAFLVGRAVCAFAEGLSLLYSSLGLPSEQGKILVPVTLIFLTALLTGIGIFDRLARFGGAGVLVPITGFANAVVSPAIDGRDEGLVLGLGSRLFVIAGPVILYGSAASALWGVILFLLTRLGLR